MMDIEQHLRENKPELPEEGQFLININARLDKVEGIKRCVDSEQKRNRKVLIAALIIGLVLGCVATLFILFCPMPEIRLVPSLFEKVSASLHKLRYLPAFLIAGCAIALGVVSINGRPRSDEIRF